MFKKVNMNDLMDAFGVMGQGMLGIFVVMAAIAVIVYIITKMGSKK